MARACALAPERYAAQRGIVAAFALALLCVLPLSGCAFRSAAASSPSLDESTTGDTADDAIGRAAFAAWANGMEDWTERASGTVGTVEATGEPDGKGCFPARLTIHDFTGIRIDERRVCPPA